MMNNKELYENLNMDESSTESNVKKKNVSMISFNLMLKMKLLSSFQVVQVVTKDLIKKLGSEHGKYLWLKCMPNKFKSIIRSELSDGLHRRRFVDHAIELEQRP